MFNRRNRSRDNSVNEWLGYEMKDRRLISGRDKGISLHLRIPTCSGIEQAFYRICAAGAFFVGIKRPEREAAFLPLPHISMKLCLINRRDKFTCAFHQMYRQQVSLFQDLRIQSHGLSPLHVSLELLGSSFQRNSLYSILLAILSQLMMVVITTRSTSLVTSALIWLI